MKELSIEEKARAYDEALEKAKEILEMTSDKSAIYTIFPELKESEDEKIRKKIIDYFRGSVGLGVAIGGVSVKDMVSWLEKQGEQKPSTEIKPKFKVGDWLVHNERKHIIKVVNPTPMVYGVVNVLGYHHTITDTAIENNYHLWSIADAKDGDVLIDKSHIGECVFIFKEAIPSDIKTDVKNPLAIIGYCGINHIGFTSQLSGIGFGDTANCTYYPAAKEQRDLLFQKMKEAGWEWNAETKELKKISQRMVSAEAKEALYDSSLFGEDEKECDTLADKDIQRYHLPSCHEFA